MIELEFKELQDTSKASAKENKKVKKNLGKKSIKLDYATVGGGLGGILFTYEQVNKGLDVLLVEKNQHWGSYYSSKIFNTLSKDKKFNYEIPLLIDNNELGFTQKYFLEHGFRNEFSLVNPKVWLEFIAKNSYINFYSDSKLTVSALKQKYSVDRHGIETLFSIFKKCYLDVESLKEYAENYPTAYDFLTTHLEKNSSFLEVFTFLEIYFNTSLKKLDTHPFLLVISSLFIGTPSFFQNGNDEFTNFLIDRITKGGIVFNNTKIDEYALSVDYLNKISGSNKNFKAKKFAIAYDLVNEKQTLLQKNNALLKKYIEIIDELDQDIKTVDATVLIGFKKSQSIYKISSPMYFVNNHNFSIESAETASDLSNNYFLVLNADGYLKNKNNSIVVKTLVSRKIYESENFESLMKEFAENQLCKQFKCTKEDISEIIVLTPKINIELFNNRLGQTASIKFDNKNPWQKRTAFTPIKNLHVATNWGAYGSEWFILKIINAMRTSNSSFIVLKKGQKHSPIDILQASEIMNLLKKQYVGWKKFDDKSIGFTFDEKHHFVLTFRKNGVCTLKETSFKEAIKAYLFIWTTTKDFQNQLTARAGIVRQVLTGRLKVRGGVFMYRKVMKKAFKNWNTFHKTAKI